MKKGAKKVLIADDNDGIREILGYMLQKRGYIIKNACNGEEAVKKTAEEKPDIIILDVAMPLMDGIEVYKQLKGNPDTRRIPIIFLSAEKNINQIIPVMPEEIVKYIEKPCDIEYLTRQIEEMIPGKS